MGARTSAQVSRKQGKPAVEEFRLDPLDPQMGGKRVAPVAPRFEHDARPEVLDDREVLRPGFVGDSAGEHGPERRIAPDLGIESLDDRPDLVLGQRWSSDQELPLPVPAAPLLLEAGNGWRRRRPGAAWLKAAGRAWLGD